MRYLYDFPVINDDVRCVLSVLFVFPYQTSKHNKKPKYLKYKQMRCVLNDLVDIAETKLSTSYGIRYFTRKSKQKQFFEDVLQNMFS